MDESARKEQSLTPLPQARLHSPLHKRLILILCNVAAGVGAVAVLYGNIYVALSWALFLRPFTLYVDVYGFFNMLGHFFKIASYTLIYLALIQSGLKRPYAVLFRNLAEKERALSRSEQKYRSFIEYTTEGVYRLEMEKPLDTRLPVESQIDALYDSAYVVECNRAFADRYGVEDPKELLSSRLIDFHGGRDHPVNREEVRRFVGRRYGSNLPHIGSQPLQGVYPV